MNSKLDNGIAMNPQTSYVDKKANENSEPEAFCKKINNRKT